jgi:hypothetical protein
MGRYYRLELRAAYPRRDIAKVKAALTRIKKPEPSESNVQNSPVFAASSLETETDLCPASSRRVISAFNFGFANSSLSVMILSSTPTARIRA